MIISQKITIQNEMVETKKINLKICNKRVFYCENIFDDRSVAEITSRNSRPAKI